MICLLCKFLCAKINPLSNTTIFVKIGYEVGKEGGRRGPEKPLSIMLEANSNQKGGGGMDKYRGHFSKVRKAL